MAKLKGQLFARLALDYADHPKVVSLSDPAFRAHVEMILYARRYETDGRIPKRLAETRWGTDSVSELLGNDLDAPSLLELPTGDYLLHGYADMQETREEIEERRQVNRQNGRKGGRPRKTQSVSEPPTDRGTRKKAETETETEHSPTESEAPTHPFPLPESWTPTDAHRALAAERGVDCDLEAAKMRDWATAEGKKGKDWDARFRNWLRSARPDRQQQARPDRAVTSARGLIQAHQDLFGSDQ
ncbi:hypothetical protein M3G50_07440 [Brachybacterium muris]|uniref:hypothetical protein n=1 Tax=Brachybacterium muris TaxID=219301 RepID=UPI0021A64F72|nr:hypothetical protein [Brachybacterium muris]MCT1430586.1 hypothetical protein [Brachybacterium muris]